MTIQKNNIDPHIEMVGDDFVCPKENLGTSSDVAQISLNDSNFNVTQTFSSDVAQISLNDSNFNVTQILNEAQTIQIQLTDEIQVLFTKPTIVWGGGDSQDGLEPDEYDNWHPNF